MNLKRKICILKIQARKLCNSFNFRYAIQPLLISNYRETVEINSQKRFSTFTVPIGITNSIFDPQICELLQKGAIYIFDEEMQVPYLIDGDQWVGFDDERSIRHKMKWIKSNGFGGAMVWTVDMDDFTGKICGGDVKYPLIGAMR